MLIKYGRSSLILHGITEEECQPPCYSLMIGCQWPVMNPSSRNHPESPGIFRNLPESPGTQTDWVVEEVGGEGKREGKREERRGK